MNLIYLRAATPKTRKFIKKKLRGGEASSIYDIQAGDCCLAPAPSRRSGYMVAFLHDVSPAMLDFMRSSAERSGLNHN